MLGSKFAPWPSYSEEEIEAVAEVLRSNRVNYWTGEEGRKFEKEFAIFAESKHAIAVTNGTVALDLALKGLDVGVGDEVIVTPRSFIASASCVVNAGATPVFADVDIDSGNLSAETIEPMITARTKAVIIVHLAGWPADMDPIMALAKEYGFFVIEDCAQAHGARYKGRSVGGIGHVGAWSFCQDKIMTTGGEGGMVTCNDHVLWKKMWSFKDHGKSWEAVYERSHPPGFRWLHESFGTNWRMTEVQAAIGRIQLRRMPEWNRIRNAYAKTLNNALAPFDNHTLRIPQRQHFNLDDSRHAYYKFYFYVCPKRLKLNWSRDRISEAINTAGVPCMHGSCSEIYQETAFIEYRSNKTVSSIISAELGRTSLMMLLHPTMSNLEISKSALVAVGVMEQASN